MPASIKDVAIRSGVSAATVSHVINETRYVSEETKDRVYAAMRELKYVPNSVARSLRTNKARTVALLIPDISNFFFTEVAEAVEDVLRQNGYNLLLCNTSEDLSLEKKQITLMNAQLVSGMILAPTSHEFDYRDMFADPEYPLVMIDRRTDRLIADTVLVDGKIATCEAVSCLIGKGHRRIGYIAGRGGLSTTNERLEGYLETLRLGGIEPDERLIMQGDSKCESGYRLTSRLIEETDATAIFVSNNLMAVGAMQCLADRGISIPSRIAIIGFDDYNWATITNPPLSAIKQPSSKLGSLAAELVLQRIGAPAGEYREHRLFADFILRKSC